MSDEEIVERARRAGERTDFSDLVHSPVSRGINSAYGIGFIDGMVEYRDSIGHIEGLDEAARKYSDGENPACPCEECLIKSFKAGAEWRDQQIPKLPNSLNEAAEDYEKNKVHSISSLGTDASGMAYYIRSGTTFSDAFKAGAEWANVKSNELTYKDIWKIMDLTDKVKNDFCDNPKMFNLTEVTPENFQKAFGEEVLRRYNEEKKEEK